MNTNDDQNSPTFQNTLRGCGRTFGSLVLFAIVPLILLCVFGFAIKTTPEYECVLRTVERNEDVIAITGEPVTPGLFAWTAYFESGGGLRQGSFSTTLSGPKGRARIQAQFYRTPVGETLGVWLKREREEITIYNGSYPCP